MSNRTVTSFLLGLTALPILFFVMEISITSYRRDHDVGSVPFKALREELQGPRNSTLGFQKIFYINLPE